MSDEHEQIVYEDENGNPIDPSALGDDVVIEEVVEEVVEVPAAAPSLPSTPQPAADPVAAPEQVPGEQSRTPKIPKALLAGAVSAVLLVGGGVAWGLHGIGNQHTAEQVKEHVADKTDAVKQTATAKRDEVTHPVVDVCNDLSKAQLDKTVSIPAESMRLRILRSAPLPSQAATALKTDAASVQILQLGADNWGVYLPQPQRVEQGPVDDFSPKTPAKKLWWKVPVDTSNDGLKVGAAASWPGGDADAAGACPAGDPGAYAVAGDVPADAKGLRSGQAEVLAIKGDASTAEASTTGAAATITAAQDGSQNRVLAVMGSSVVVATLEYAPEQTAPATTTEGR